MSTRHQAISRRRMLADCTLGFGAVALANMLPASASAAPVAGAALPKLHHPAKAKNVIFCYMSGGVSHVDSFDPKPRLDRDHGKPMPMPIERTQFNNNGNLLASPSKFSPARPERHSGQRSVSADRHVRRRAGRRSLDDHQVQRTRPGQLLHAHRLSLHGQPQRGRLDRTTAWGARTRTCPASSCCAAATGSAAPRRRGPVQQRLSAGRTPGVDPAGRRAGSDPQHQAARDSDLQRGRLDFVRSWTRRSSKPPAPTTAQVEAAIRNYETAYRMQAAVPELVDLSARPKPPASSTASTAEDAEQAAYARQCLLARRLVERGVRFVELTCLTNNIGAGNARQPLGPARRLGKRAREHGPAGRPADRRADRGLAPSRPARRNADHLGGRVRPHAVLAGHQRPRPRSVRLQRLDGGRRHERRHHLRRHRRVRLSRRRKPVRHLRSLGHRPAPARRQPRA